MTPAESIEIITRVVRALGHAAINPESIVALRQSISDWGYMGTAQKAGITASELRFAHEDFNAQMDAMFAPTGIRAVGPKARMEVIHRPDGRWLLVDAAEYESKVRAAEAEGMTRSDAQAVVDAEYLGRREP